MTAETAVWVDRGDGSHTDLTEHLRLVSEGLVPLDTSINSCPVRRVAERRPTMARKSKSKSALPTSKAALRKYLLAHTTVPDRAWVEGYGSPEREKGEKREAFIRRVLA